MNERKKLARRMKEARERAGIGQAAAAYRAGMNRDVLVRIEAGLQDPTPAQLEKLAAMYGADLQIWNKYAGGSDHNEN